MPGPRAWPLVGDPKILRGARDLLGFYENYWRRYGDVFRVATPGPTMIMLSHPDAIKHVLWTNRQNYIKGNIYDGARRVLGDGLLTLDGDAWRTRRDLAQPAFHRQAIQQLTEHMAACGTRFFDALLQRARSGALTIDAHREMVAVTLDVVVRALFGQRFEQNVGSYELFTEAQKLVGEGANYVLPEWIPTPHNRKLRATLAALDRDVYAFIEAARRHDDGDSLLSMLLAARDDKGQPLSDRMIRNEMMTMFVAGHETSALTLTWMFLLLDGHKAVIERMQSEVDANLGEREPTFRDIPQLVYVRQVIDEVLRLRSPLPMVARNAIADDCIAGYRVRAGEVVVPLFWASHRHPDFWSDPERFDPERFHPDRAQKRYPYSYVPFSAGPRTCIGNTFSLVEMTLLVAQLLQRFEIGVQPCGHIKAIFAASSRPSAPVHIELRARAKV